MAIAPVGPANVESASRELISGRRATRLADGFAPLASLLAYAVVAWYVYRPLAPRPFDMVDFSEFLPILRLHDSLGSRFTGLVQYYAAHGRFNPVVYFFLALKWSLFGDDVVAWQSVRAIQMLGLTVATYLFLRRLRIGTSGAILGAGLLVVSAPAARAWVRLTMAEPFGLTAIVCAGLLASYYQEAASWRRLAVSIAALVALTLLTKEMLIAAVPLVLFIGCCRSPNGDFQTFQWSRRNRALVSITAVAAAVVLIPIGLVALRAIDGAYIGQYGRGGVGVLDLLRLELFTLVPFVPIGDPTPIGLAIAGLSYFGLLMLGLKLFADALPARRQLVGILGIGLVYPLLGAAIYLPWPAYQWFYSVPFLLGPAVLLGAAVTGVEDAAPRWRPLSYVAAGCVLANMASDAMLLSRRTESSQFLVNAAADGVAKMSGLDSVYVAARELPTQAWQGFGQTLARYGRATGRPFPPTVDVSCSDADLRARQPRDRTALLVFSTHCAYTGSPAFVISHAFTWLDWGHAKVRHDSISVAVFVPNVEPLNRSPK